MHPSFCSQKFAGSLPQKSERLSCLKSFGQFLFCDCRTNRVRLSAKIAAKKRAKITLISFYLSFFISLIPHTTNSRISLLNLSNLSAFLFVSHKFFIASGTVGLLNKHNLNCFCFSGETSTPKPLIVNASF